MAALPSFSVNKETLAFAAGIIALLTVGWNVVSYFKGLEPQNNPVIQTIERKNVEQDDRLDRNDRYRERQLKATEEQTGALNEQKAETQKLNIAITRLTTVLEQNGMLTKKAEYVPIVPMPLSPSRQSINYEVQ